MPLGFEELPDGARLQELRSFLFDNFKVLIQLERLWIARLQQLFEIAFESQMAPVDHEGIHIGPQLLQVGDIADMALEIRNGWNRNVSAHTRGAGAARILNGRLIGFRYWLDGEINVL